MIKKNSQALAILVGIGPGLGFALAKRFARENYIVAIIARDKEKLNELTEQINQDKKNVYSFSADVSKPEDIASTFNQIRQQFGAASILIYNAGGKFELKGINEINPENFINNWKVSCLGGLLAAQQVLPEMVKQQQGTLIFTGATAALRGGAKMASFAVGKFSQRALAQSMAREFGPQGIHVAHVIIDGIIATPFALKNFPDRPRSTFLDPDAIAEMYWQLHVQDPTAWTQEMDLRPAVEKF